MYFYYDSNFSDKIDPDKPIVIEDDTVKVKEEKEDKTDQVCLVNVIPARSAHLL